MKDQFVIIRKKWNGISHLTTFFDELVLSPFWDFERNQDSIGFSGILTSLKAFRIGVVVPSVADWTPLLQATLGKGTLNGHDQQIRKEAAVVKDLVVTCWTKNQQVPN